LSLEPIDRQPSRSGCDGPDPVRTRWLRLRWKVILERLIITCGCRSLDRDRRSSRHRDRKRCFPSGDQVMSSGRGQRADRARRSFSTVSGTSGALRWNRGWQKSKSKNGNRQQRACTRDRRQGKSSGTGAVLARQWEKLYAGLPVCSLNHGVKPTIASFCGMERGCSSLDSALLF